MAGRGRSAGMTRDEVAALMKAATGTDDDWAQRCAQVKRAFGGVYPPFWWDLMMSGDAASTAPEGSGR